MTDDLKKALTLMKQFPDKKPGRDGNVFFSSALDFDSEEGIVFNDYYKAVRILEEPANKGGADAQFAIGIIYLDAPCSIRNVETAAGWLSKAAAQGHAGAQFRLGEIYASGERLKQDFNEAVKWYKKAAAQGNAGGQLGLGICYANGTGVPQDNKIAIELLEKSAAQGNVFAEHNLYIVRQNVENKP